MDGLAALLRQLRRRHARSAGDSQLTYRELASRTGWALGAIGEYFTGKTLPPTDRFDVLVRLLGASEAEQGALATARDRVEERRRAAAPAPPPDRPNGPAGTARAGAAGPAQLPLEARGFVNRARELAMLDAALAAAEQDRSAGVIVAVSGTAGVGKTALAVRWAHLVAGRFPDGQLFVNLRGYDQDEPVRPADVLARFLRALGVVDVPADAEERAAKYRTALSGRRVLVVLDNANGAEQVRPLLPGTPTCAVLVTSRDSLGGLVAVDGARRLAVDLLPNVEATGLLRRLLDRDAEADTATLAALAEQCARLPLALRVAAELANARQATPLPALVGELADQRRRLDLLDSGGDVRGDVRAVLSWSYQSLSPAAAAAFRLLSLHPGLEFDAYATAALLDADLPAARHLLDTFGRSHLVHRAGPGRFGMHDLLRAYAADLAAGDAEPVRGAAELRLVDYYLAVAAAAMDAVHPAGQQRRPRVPPAATPMPVLAEHSSALAWLDAERDSLVSIAGIAAQRGWLAQAVDLSRTLSRYLNVGGYHDAALAIHGHALEAATRAGDLAGQAHALASMAAVRMRLGDYASAGADYERALALHRKSGERAGEANVLLDLGSLAGRQGQYDAAAGHLGAALAVYQDIGSHLGTAAALSNLGLVYQYTGRYPLAIEHHQRALAELEQTPDRVGQAHTLANLAAVLTLVDRHADSAEQYGRAIAIFREAGDRSGQTSALNGLGESLAALGQYDRAHARHADALALAEQTGNRYEEGRAHRGLGDADDRTGNQASAQSHWAHALEVFAELGVPDEAHLRARLAGPAGN